jgi:glutathione S-transferase
MVNKLQLIGVQFSTFVRAVQFCCEEIGLEYQIGTDYKGINYGLRTAELTSLNPFGKVPVLIQDDKVLYETFAICRYLDNQFNHSRLQPEDTWLRAQVDQWCSALALYVDKVIVRDFLLEYRFPKGEKGAVRMDIVNAAIPEIIAKVALLEAQLGNRNYLVGDEFTLADIMLMPMLNYLLQVPSSNIFVREDSPLRAYALRILQRPAAKNVFI